MTTTADPELPNRPAGFWRRVFAGCFDIFFLLTVGLVLLLEIIAAVSIVQYFGWGAGDTPEGAALLWAVLGPLWGGTSMILIPVLYYTLTEGAFGQTLGKALFGIVVISADGRPLTYGRAFARLLTLPYAFVPVGVGFLWAALPPAKRGWHDYISATRVVSVA